MIGLLFMAPPLEGAQETGCASLEELRLAGVVLTSLEAEDPDVTRGWPARCVVSGAIRGRIRFVLHLPVADAWNGRFLMGGGGGFGGVLANQALSPGLPGGDAVQRGYATIGTDTGHRGTGPSPTLDLSWAVDDWPAILDFGYRAVHETASVGKVLVERHYGIPPQHSYFFGCSNGRRQGLMEAQRYPHTFDGIVAGAPGLDLPGMILHFVRVAQAMFPDGDPERPVLSEARIRELSDAVHGALRLGGRLIHPGYPPGHEAAPGAWDLRITGHVREGGPVNLAATVQFVGAMLMNNPAFSLDDVPSLEALWSRTDMVARVLNATIRFSGRSKEQRPRWSGRPPPGPVP